MYGSRPLPYTEFFLFYENAKIKYRYAVYIFIGSNGKADSQNFLSKGALSTYLPEKYDLTTYNWLLFKDKPVILFDSGDADVQLMRKLAAILLKIGSPVVSTYEANGRIAVYNAKDINQ